MPQSVLVTMRGGVKAVLTIPWTVDQLQYGQGRRDKITDERDAFEKVPLIFRAVNLRCNNLIRMPWLVQTLDGKEMDEYPFEEELPLESLLWKTEASLLMAGVNYIIKLVNSSNVELGLQWLNPFTVTMKKEQGQWIYYQTIDGIRYPEGIPNYWTDDDMWHMKEFSMTDDVIKGVAATTVGLMSGRVKHYVSYFAANFFENGAMPVTMVALPAGTDPAERSRVENFFKRSITAVRNAFRVLGIIGGETKVNILTPPLKDLDLTVINTTAINDVAWAFDIPKTVLTADSANFATAKEEYESFIKHTIAPRSKRIATLLNKRFKEFGFKVVPQPEELSEMQEDEMNRSQAFRNYVLSGMWPQLAAEVLGIAIPEKFQKEWESNKATPVASGRAEITPVGGAPKEQEPAQETSVTMPVKSAMIDELEKWQTKSLRRVKEGKSAQVDFVSDHIPSRVHDGIYGLLAEAKSQDHVKLLFTATINHFSGASQ